MDFDEYVAARYGRLIEHAVLLGCAEGEAGTYVDKVLLEQRKAIRRAEDPDPLVHEALDRAISGAPEKPSRTGPVLAVGLVLAVIAAAVALTYQPPPEPMPSLFALDGEAAQQLLEDQGYDVVLRPARACEPQGLVLGSEPVVGEPVRSGATVTVRTAVPSGTDCTAQYQDRSDAWDLVGFFLGAHRDLPPFDDEVTLVVDDGAPRTLTQEEAGSRSSWGEVPELVRAAAEQAAPTTSGMPVLGDHTLVPSPERCGVRRPTVAGGGFALRLEIDPRRPQDDTGCPLALDLYRVDGRITTVVVYTARGLDGSSPGLDVDPAGLRPADPPAA